MGPPDREVRDDEAGQLLWPDNVARYGDDADLAEADVLAGELAEVDELLDAKRRDRVGARPGGLQPRPLLVEGLAELHPTALGRPATVRPDRLLPRLQKFAGVVDV